MGGGEGGATELALGPALLRGNSDRARLMVMETHFLEKPPARNELWKQHTRRSGRTGDEHLVKSKEDLDEDQNDDVPLDAQAAAGL